MIIYKTISPIDGNKLKDFFIDHDFTLANKDNDTFIYHVSYIKDDQTIRDTLFQHKTVLPGISYSFYFSIFRTITTLFYQCEDVLKPYLLKQYVDQFELFQIIHKTSTNEFIICIDDIVNNTLKEKQLLDILFSVVDIIIDKLFNFMNYETLYDRADWINKSGHTYKDIITKRSETWHHQLSIQTLNKAELLEL